MSHSTLSFFSLHGLRLFALGAATLGATLVSAAPTFKNIKPLPLVAERPAPTIAAEVRKAFDAELAACRELARDNAKAAEADAAFGKLVKAQTIEDLRVEALEAHANFLFGNRERAFDEQALAAFDQLLALRGQLTGKVKSWLNSKQAIQRRQKQHAAAFDTTLVQLAVPELTADEIGKLKHQAVDLLLADGRGEEAVELAREVVQDAAAPLGLRFDIGRKAAGWLRVNLRKPSEAAPLLDELLQLPLDSAQRTTVRQDLIYLVNHAIKPRDSEAVWERSMALIDDAETPIATRLRVATELLSIYEGERGVKDRARPVPVAEKLLAEKNLPVAEEVRLREMLQRALNTVGRGDDALAQAEIILANTNAPVASRVAANASLAWPMTEAKDFAAAEKRLRHALTLPGLNTTLVAQILESIGRLYLLQEQEDKALPIYTEAYRYFQTDDMTNRVIKLTVAALSEAYRFEEAAQLWLDRGDKLEAANVLARQHSPFGERARELRLQVLEDEKSPLQARASAYPSFLTADPRDVPVAEKYHELFIRANTNHAIRTFGDRITRAASGTAYYGDFAGTVRYLGWLKPLVKPNLDFKTTLCGINAYADLGRLDEAVALAREAVDYTGFKPEEIYQLKMTAAALGLRDPKMTVEAAKAALAKADAVHAKETELEPAQRASALASAGGTVLQARLNNTARAIAALREGLYVPRPRKTYKVTFSDRPISGLDSWDSIAPKTERQIMDRTYGGNMEFLMTDVATGARGEGIGTDADAKKQKPTEISFICDDNGLHFRFDAYDERAAEVKARLLGAGSYEGYIAPGENQPYICFLIDLQSGRLDLYNTTYDTMHHRRVTADRSHLYRGEHRFREDGYTTYVFLSWQAYAEKIPEAGTVWDFENAHWGRAGSSTWNGLESIHGRSTWGALVFDIPPAGRVAIKRQLVFKALASYKGEKRTSHHHEGALDHWLDSAVGDPEFYEARLRPLVERLDAYIPLVKADMSDADVEKVYNEALFGWNNLRDLVDAERRKYLAEKLTR